VRGGVNERGAVGERGCMGGSRLGLVMRKSPEPFDSKFREFP
jgi:hypothetical protein